MHIPKPFRVLPAAVLALGAVVVAPLGSQVSAKTSRSHAWQSMPSAAAPATSVSRRLTLPTHGHDPLLVRERYRHTFIHILPSTTWFAKHSKLVHGRNGLLPVHGSGSLSPAPFDTANSALPQPTCVLGSDSSANDAKPVLPGGVNDGQFDSLDISAVGFSTTGGNLQAQIKVISLKDGSGGDPAVPNGQVDNWFAQFDLGGTTYYLRAQYAGGDPTTTTVYTYGTVQTEVVETLHVPSGSASGSMDLNNGIVTISIPLSDIGTPATGTALSSETFETDVQVGSPLYQADALPAPLDYDIGDSSANGTCRQPKTSLPGPVPTQGTTKNLRHFGGPIVHTIHNYLIFWDPKAGTTNCPNNGANPNGTYAGPSYFYEPPKDQTGTLPGSGSDQNYEGILEQYFKDLPGTSYYNLLTQYADNTTGTINNNEALGGVWTDNCGYTSTPSPGNGSTVGGTTANPVYDYDIQQEVLRAMQANGWKPGLGNEYFVYLGYSVATCFNPNISNPAPGCDITGAPPSFCAYHGDFIDNSGNPVLYANMTDGGLQTAFTCYQSPIGATDPVHNVNGQQLTDAIADAEVSITSHEQFETDTDAMIGTAATYAPPLGWYDPAGGEIGDKCAYLYGNYNPKDGANITLANGDRYIVQLEWSNWANGCSVGDSSVAPSPFGGISDAVTMLPGWNLIDLPAAGITSTNSLTTDMTRSGQLPTGSVQEVATFKKGMWSISIPGVTVNHGLNRTDGMFVLTKLGSAMTYAPSGTPYTTPVTVHFGRGWNLVGATWPDPGVMTDAMFNEIQAETGACSHSQFANELCTPTVGAIDAYGPSFDHSGNVSGGQYLNWSPAGLDANGNPTWPQPYGNQVPFTNGMWVQSTKSLAWTPQGNECLTIANGMCQ